MTQNSCTGHKLTPKGEMTHGSSIPQPPATWRHLSSLGSPSATWLVSLLLQQLLPASGTFEGSLGTLSFTSYSETGSSRADETEPVDGHLSSGRNQVSF